MVMVVVMVVIPVMVVMVVVDHRCRLHAGHPRWGNREGQRQKQRHTGTEPSLRQRGGFAAARSQVPGLPLLIEALLSPHCVFTPSNERRSNTHVIDEAS